MSENLQNDESSKTSISDEDTNKTSEDANVKINSIITSRFKAFEKSLDKMLEAKLSAFAPKQPEEKTEGSTVKVSPEVKELQAQIAKMQEKELANETKFKAEKLNSTLKDKLLELGVDPKMARAAIAILKEDQAVKYNDENELIFYDRHTGEQDLSAGLKNWSKSEEAKNFKAASTISGSGAKSPNTDANGDSSKLSNQEAERTINQWMENPASLLK